MDKDNFLQDSARNLLTVYIGEWKKQLQTHQDIRQITLNCGKNSNDPT